MIIIPNLDRATFIRKEMFCTISGLPNQIVEKFLMADTHIDENIAVQFIAERVYYKKADCVRFVLSGQIF